MRCIPCKCINEMERWQVIRYCYTPIGLGGVRSKIKYTELVKISKDPCGVQKFRLRELGSSCLLNPIDT